MLLSVVSVDATLLILLIAMNWIISSVYDGLLPVLCEAIIWTDSHSFINITIALKNIQYKFLDNMNTFIQINGPRYIVCSWPSTLPYVIYILLVEWCIGVIILCTELLLIPVETEILFAEDRFRKSYLTVARNLDTTVNQMWTILCTYSFCVFFNKSICMYV